jgi:hypothetical protein
MASTIASYSSEVAEEDVRVTIRRWRTARAATLFGILSLSESQCQQAAIQIHTSAIYCKAGPSVQQHQCTVAGIPIADLSGVCASMENVSYLELGLSLAGCKWAKLHGQVGLDLISAEC